MRKVGEEERKTGKSKDRKEAKAEKKGKQNVEVATIPNLLKKASSRPTVSNILENMK